MNDNSGQAMTEYVIVSTGIVIGMIALLNSEVLTTFPEGFYKGIYLMLKGMIINVAIPIP